MNWRPRFGRFMRQYSLRQRYLGVAVFLGMVVAISALLTERYVSSTNRASADNIETRTVIHQRTRVIRDAIRGTEYALQAYILKPTPGQRKAISANIQKARENITALHNLAWTRSNNLQDMTSLLGQNFDTLARYSTELMEVRANLKQRLLSTNLMDDTLSPVSADRHAAAAPLIQDRVQPLFAEIWSRIDKLDVQLEISAEHDISLWIAVSQRLNNNLLFLSLLAGAFIILGYVFFQRTVLDPIAKISHAMKAIAVDEVHVRLPRANSVEARELIDAFVHMRRKVHERQIALRHQALHDTLTNLPNRTLLKDRLQQAIHRAERAQKATFSLLMIDLDRFKEINDTLGHQAGDHVLHEIGNRLAKLLRKSDTVARLGGDEFALLLPDTGIFQAQEIAQTISDAIAQPLYYQDRALPVGASIGIAVYPEHGHNSELLFKCADVAMYVAKQDNLHCSVYDPQEDPHSVGRLALISELRTAIMEDGLSLHYQPKLEMISGDVIGVEALLRWPKWSAIPTEYLIKTAETTGLIQQLTHWVLRQALQQIALWQQHGIEMPVAVNLSTWNLSHTDIETTVQSLLKKYAVPAYLLELEITENAMMKNPERAHAILNKLHALGVNLSVDDYGTGYSSLSYLKTMPVNQIKIDKSFVFNMLEDENDAVIVRSTIDLAHNLGLKVVAEGVSSAEIWRRLEVLGCDTAQGYYIARPMPAEALVDWLANYRNDDNALRA